MSTVKWEFWIAELIDTLTAMRDERGFHDVSFEIHPGVPPEDIAEMVTHEVSLG